MRLATGHKKIAALRHLAAESPLPFRAVGNCMSPVMGHGANIEISARKFYWPGDVIAYASDRHGYVSHRVIGYRLAPGGLQLVTKSDRSSACDPPVDLKLVVGRITGGNCEPEAFMVPFRHRLRAAAQFGLLFLSCLWRRAARLSERAAAS